MDYRFKNMEEKLLHLIRVNGSTFEEYADTVKQVNNLNYTDGNDSGFLHEAVIHKRADIAADLLERGIAVNLQNVTGNTAAILAAANEQWDILWMLLNDPLDVNLKDWQHGNSLLWHVVFYNTEERNRIAKHILAMGANPYSKNQYGKSPLDLVTRGQNEELIAAFESVSDPCTEEIPRFRIPRNAAGIFSMKMKDYQKYICVKSTTAGYLEGKIKTYAKICEGKKKKYHITITPVNHGEWFVLWCSPNMDFYNYHNLMSWFWGTSEDAQVPEQNLCVAFHEDERCSYYGIIENMRYGDQIAGRYQNGESFYIYLPEAYKKGGNAKSYSDVLPIQSISEYLKTCGFDPQWISEAAQLPGIEVEVEMAV